MSCNSLIDVATTTSTSVLANAAIPFNTIVRRRGREIGQSGTAVVISDCGSNFYLVNVTVTFTAPAEGTATIALQQNGATVVGGTASATVSTEDTQVLSLSFAAIVRTYNSQSIVDTLTLLNSGIAITVTNADMTVVKL